MTRADAFVNFTYLMTLLAPVLALVSIRFARGRNFQVHRRIQVALVATCWLAVLVLETRIRLEGGSGSFIAQAQPQWQGWARRLLLVHISMAVLSYGLWTGLAIVSWRRFQTLLPGAFSQRHRLLGWVVFGGLCFDAVSASGMYFLAFVL